MKNGIVRLRISSKMSNVFIAKISSEIIYLLIYPRNFGHYPDQQRTWNYSSCEINVQLIITTACKPNAIVSFCLWIIRSGYYPRPIWDENRKGNETGKVLWRQFINNGLPMYHDSTRGCRVNMCCGHWWTSEKLFHVTKKTVKRTRDGNKAPTLI